MFGVTILAFILIMIYALRFKKVPPGKAMVIWGRSAGPKLKGPIIATGGGRFIWPVVQDYSYISTGPWNVKVNMRDVPVKGSKDPFLVNVEVNSLLGVNLIHPTDGALKAAAENLLGKKEDEIIGTIKPYLENALRKVLVEQNENTIRDWLEIEEWVMVETQKELLKIGLEVRAVCIRELYPSNMKG